MAVAEHWCVSRRKMRLHDVMVARQAIKKKETTRNTLWNIHPSCLHQRLWSGSEGSPFPFRVILLSELQATSNSCCRVQTGGKMESTSVAAQTLHSYLQVPCPCTINTSWSKQPIIIWYPDRFRNSSICFPKRWYTVQNLCRSEY